jgi:hypothetical protein
MRLRWLVVILLLPTVGGDGIVSIPPEEEPAIVFAVEIPLDGGEVHQVDHVVELFTAQWCDPCRPAEFSADQLDESHPDVAIVELHSSEIDDNQYFDEAGQRHREAGVDRYPTFVVDNRWRLMSRSQTDEIDDLVDAIEPLGSSLGGNATREGGVIRIELNDASAVSLDIWVVDDLTAVAGRTNLSWNGTAAAWTIPISDGQQMLDADHVLVIGRTGQTQLRTGSTTVMDDSTPVFDDKNASIAILIGVLILVLMAPALMNTVKRLPVLLGPRRDEEE